jgi:diguanylate cyclase (GGDEF)-like protein
MITLSGNSADQRRDGAIASGIKCLLMKTNSLGATSTIGSRMGAGLDNSVLIVDDDPRVVQVMGQILAGVGELRFATNGDDALRLARESAPDLILLDAEMPGMSGFQLFESLSMDPALANVPVIFVTSHSEAEFEISALEMGAVDFIGKPFRASLVLARVKNQLRAKHIAEELGRVTATDVVTGIANRRQFDELLEREWRRARRGGDPLSLLLVDIDHFRLYNERHGHPSGDACLRSIAELLTGFCRRPADLVARCGGDEFMVLLPQTRRNGAEQVAHRIVDAIASLDTSDEQSSAKRQVTATIGIACHDEFSATWVNPGPKHRLGGDGHIPGVASDLVLAADAALNCAKRERRVGADIPRTAHASVSSHAMHGPGP